MQAHGANTLKLEHVLVDGDKVTFDFIGKSNVRQRHIVYDGDLAVDVVRRISLTDDRLFHTSACKTLNYLKKVSGNPAMKVHYLRTWNATSLAGKIVASEKPPETAIVEGVSPSNQTKLNNWRRNWPMRLGERELLYLPSWLQFTPLPWQGTDESAPRLDAWLPPRAGGHDATAN